MTDCFQILSQCDAPSLRAVVSNWRATALQSSAPNHTCLEVSSNPEELDSLDQVCLISVGAKLCRAVALQEWSLRPMTLLQDLN